MLKLALLSFYNLDVAYTLRKVFEERLAGLGKVHICSGSLLVFKTSQPCTTQEAQENTVKAEVGEGSEGVEGKGGGWEKSCVVFPQQYKAGVKCKSEDVW